MTFRPEVLRDELANYFDHARILDELIAAIAPLDPRWRQFVADWIIAIAQSDPTVAFQFARRAPAALLSLDRNSCEQWLKLALDALDADGANAAIEVIRDLDGFIAAQRKRSRGLAFAEVRNVFSLLLQGLEGRELMLETSDEIFTDCETIRVPAIIDRYTDREQNLACYRACLIHQWAQCWYGTWRADTIAQIPREEPQLSTFHYLETLRLNACLARDYPGLARQLQALTPANESWQAQITELEDPSSTVSDSIRLSADHWDKPRPARFDYQGILDPDRVQARQEARLQREQQQLQQALTRHAAAQRHAIVPSAAENEAEIRQLLVSIRQDLGQVPEAWLELAESSVSTDATGGESTGNAAASETLADSESDSPQAFVYDEWDCVRNAHRKRWCLLRERDIEPDFAADFVGTTLQKYRGQVKTLRRSFEYLREEYRILKRQPDGESLDFDALVEALADARSGMEMTSRIYRKSRRVARDIAVIFMVDMSGSMKGWINLAQREALILLAEALQTLNDRYAIYGFSGNTRKRCELFRVKTFDEAYDTTVQARIAAIEPHHFTRMGVTIRHLSHLLQQADARTRLLITLSDGRPYDYDNYRDEYAIEDTRMALYEARHRGIHPFCITIDEQARDYLPHMYGESSFTLINDVGKLPYRISEVYRGLTS